MALVVTALMSAAACSAPDGGDSSGSGSSGGAQLVLADSREPGELNPILGYGQHGNSLIYDGLLRMSSGGADALPDLVPNLAAGEPTISSDGRTWTVKVREGVTFSDGSALDSADVAATFNAVINPRTASTLAPTLEMLSKAEAVDPQTVRFTLKHPYAEFDSRLLLGIAPSQAFTGTPAAEMSLNTKPIGTGRYVLSDLSATQTVLTPREGQETEYDRITLTAVEDDNTRAQRMSAGELDGTVLPPSLSSTFDEKSGFKVARANTVDFRAIALPGKNAFAKETVARRAMNMAVDRKALIDKILMGHGAQAHTPVPQQLGDAYEASATFTHSLDGAKKLLDDAGWKVGSDGIRIKNGNRAAFTLMYSAADTLRRDLAVAFAADMKKLGVQATLEGTNWDRIEAKLPQGQSALVLAGGEYPTSIDSLVYEPLHRRTATSSPYSNPGNFGSAAMDTRLANARKEQDQAKRQQLYREIQKSYVQDPAYVYLAFLTHDYVAKESVSGLDTTLVVEPHAHDSMWGPWWNLGQR